MYRKSILFLIFLFLLSTQLYAKGQEITQKAPIVVNGDRVEYFHDQKKVIGTGNISIDYQDVKLTCDKVTVYLDTREAIAEGNVKVTQKDTYLTGDKMNYNFDTKVGKIINGYVNYVPFYGKSGQVDKVSENHIDIQKGYMTTCDLDKPHYRIEAKQINIYLEDKVVANNITFYVGNCPIMYLPYYYQPINKEQSTHVTVVPGHDRDWGYYALTSLKFDYSEIFKGRFRVDYRSNNGYAAGIDNEYSLPGLGNGVAKFYEAQDQNKYFTWKPKTREEGKYRLQIRHKWQVTDDTLFTLELNKVRDDNFMKYFFVKEWEEQQQPDNYLSFVKTTPSFTTTFLYRQRMDKYYDVVQRMPEFTVDVPKYNIKYNGKSSPLYYDFNFDPVVLNHTFAPSTTIQNKDLRTIRVDTYNKLSYAMKPIPALRSLNVTPFAGTRQTYYSREMLGNTNLMRGIFDTGVDNSIKFYKVYKMKTDALGLDINNLRHIITPTASYLYTPEPTVPPLSLYQYDGIDTLGLQNHVIFSLENKLQTKRGTGDKMTSVDLVDFILSTDYQFRVEDRPDHYVENKFRSVDMQLELTPYPWIYALAKMRVNAKRELPESASVDFVGGKEEYRSLAFGYRYERSFDPNIPANPDDNGNIVNYLTTDAIYKLNEIWKARVYWRFNMNKGYIDEHQYILYRDLHCWILEFTYDLRPYEDNKTISTQTFWISLRLKAFPTLPLGVNRSYSRTRAGEAGDPGFMERQRLSAGRGGY